MRLHRPWLRVIPSEPDEASTRAMIRPPARIAPSGAAAALALGCALAAPLAAQQNFELPPASPSPTPVPAGPADERAGVTIPPRSVPAPAPSTSPTVRPTASPSTEIPADVVILPPPEFAPPRRGAGAGAGAPSPTPAATSTPQPGATGDAPAPTPGLSTPDPAPPGLNLPENPAALPETTDVPTGTSVLPAWWPLAAGGLGALVLLGAGAVRRRVRKPKTLRLAAPRAGAPAAVPVAQEPPRIDLALEITAATRSLMMFTLEYRLTIANRSDRAVNDARLAVQLACARASASNAPATGAARALADVARIGPSQSRSITGTVQLPLSSIAPLRQGQTPLFVPLVHVTLEAEGLPAATKSFVIGTPGSSGRVQPIRLDIPPGTIAVLVAQPIAVPAMPAAA